MSKLKNTMNRRDFVVTSTVAVVGAASCFSIGAKEALARARATGTIPLTADNLNRLFEEQFKAGRIKTVAKEISADITGWLGRQCALTPVQERRIKSIPKEKWDDIRKVLQVVADKGGRLSVEIKDPEGVFKHHASPLSCRGSAKAEIENPDGTTTTVQGSVGFET
jgi:hypothetical protein